MSKILVVDDDAAYRDCTVEMLQRGGHEVVGATSPLAAVALLRSMPFDAVVTDVLMPEMDGIELLREVIVQAPRTEVIVVSGCPFELQEPVQRLMHALGVRSFLTKPVDPEHLAAAVAACADSRR